MADEDNDAAELMLNSMMMPIPEYGPDDDTPVESDFDEDELFQQSGYSYSRLDEEENDEDDMPLSRLVSTKDVLSAAEDVVDAGADADDEDDQPLSNMRRGLDNEERRWRKKDVKRNERPFKEMADTVNKDVFGDCSCPTDSFLLFFDKNIRENIVFETNRYATQKGRKFPPLTDNELLGFVGINFFMGYHHLPNWRDYWSSQEDLHVSIVSQTMPRNRFGSILSNLHCKNNLEMPEGNKDRLFKLRPLIDGMNERFAFLYHMGKTQSIDESMIRFKGRSSLKQYNPMKPIKRGYKLWARADDSGYIGQFEVYQGKGEEVKDHSVPDGYGLGERVIHNFTRPLTGKNYQVFFDNFFSSVRLMEDLKKDDVLAAATIRANRKNLPQLIEDKKLKERGQSDHRVNDRDVTVYKWKDNKPILLISNNHGSEQTTVKRTQKDGKKIDVECPVVVSDYNKHMGGVDKADMLRVLYGVDRKAMKWWHRIFWGILDIAFVNSYVAFQSMHGKTPLLQFRRKVAVGLLTLAKPKPTVPKRGRPSSPGAAQAPPTKILKRRKSGYSVPDDVRLQNVGTHMPEFVAGRGRCEMCSMNKVESRPHSKCSTCKVFLCLNEKKNCFYPYHCSK